MNIQRLIAKELARQAGVARYQAKLHEPLAVAKRFWSKVKQGEVDQCWPWLGCLNDLGYGQLTHECRRWKAHRFAYFLTFGDFDRSLDVLHGCDNPPCCNPKHLRLGTASDNIREAYLKGRKIAPSMKGVLHPMAKINEEQALEIRSLFATGRFSKRSLGKQFGITACAIYSIVNRKIWRHI